MCFNKFMIVTFFITLFCGCGGSQGFSNPALDICEPSQVAELPVRVTYGSAVVYLTMVSYNGRGENFSTSVEYRVTQGNTFGLQYCQIPGTGDIVFKLEVYPTGESRNPDYSHEVEMYFGEVEFADIHIWDDAGFDDSGTVVGVQSLTNGESEEFSAAIETWQY